MRIASLLKTTLLDFPGRVAAVIFTQGCNFHCPYCHNPALVVGQPSVPEQISEAEVLEFLQLRARLLQGLVISGGEPTLQPALPAFCETVKAMGYAIKLDTNGSRPQVLELLLQENLLDYVALDLKSAPQYYSPHLSINPMEEAMAESMALLHSSNIPHEYRTTCVSPFVSIENFSAMLNAIQGKAPLYLQQARLDHVLDRTFFQQQGRALSRPELDHLCQLAQDAGQDCRIR